MAKLTPVRGTKDYLPNEAKLREKIRSIILDTYIKHGFSKITTPVLEDIELLLGGDSGDNTKLIYKILKRGEKLNLENVTNENDLVDAGLRYDLTVPLARFYANNNPKLLPVFKSIQIDDVFRAERPQKGRQRQFVQCDIDIIGDDSKDSDIEVLYVSAKALLNLGFKNFEFRVNDRRILNSVILKNGFKKEDIESVSISIDKLDKIGKEGVREELLSKEYNPIMVDNFLSNITIIESDGLESLSKFVEKDVIDDISRIINTINYFGKDQYKAIFDVKIIRGQGYYTSSVFEVYLDGFAGASGGGGRYDNMISKITEKENVPAVGFSLGFERLFLIISENNMLKDNEKSVALLYEEDDEYKDVLLYEEKLLKEYNVYVSEKRKNLKFQLLNLKDNGISKYTIFKEKEIKEIE